MESSKQLQINGKKFTVFVFDDADNGLAINYTPGDQSRNIDDITLIKPSFRSPNHPVWYEITSFNPDTKNHVVIARIQVDS